jgi:NifU-like protein involved in Fe-S cluster formation
MKTGEIKDVKFKTFGCGYHQLASSSLATSEKNEKDSKVWDTLLK